VNHDEPSGDSLNAPLQVDTGEHEVRRALLSTLTVVSSMFSSFQRDRTETRRLLGGQLRAVAVVEEAVVPHGQLRGERANAMRMAESCAWRGGWVMAVANRYHPQPIPTALQDRPQSTRRAHSTLLRRETSRSGAPPQRADQVDRHLRRLRSL